MLRGAWKAERERIITQAHQIEVMARQKALRRLAHYLREPKAPAKGDATVLLTPDERAQLRKLRKG